MKKFVTLALTLALLVTSVFGLASCNSGSGDNKPKTDWEIVQANGYFTCGITGYAPMNYFNDDGDLVGFDTEFAQAVAEELGVKVRFNPISWGSKYLELNAGTIDAIWNGFTFGNEDDGTSRADYVDFSYAYLNNSQCVVFNNDVAASVTTKEGFAALNGTAEGGSSGESIAKELCGENYVATASQASALLEVKNGTSDFAVIDKVMADAYVGVGDYTNISISDVVVPEGEVFAIGFRKGSDFTAKVNEAIKKVQASGKLAEIAEKYELSNALIAEIGK